MIENYTVSAEHADGYSVVAEKMSGWIFVQFLRGTDIVETEDFTVSDSGIRTEEVLKSYCETRLAQWKYLKWEKTAR